MDYTKLIKREKSALHLALEKEEDKPEYPPIVYLNNSKKLDFETFCEKYQQEIDYIISCYTQCLKRIPKNRDIKFKLMDGDFYNNMQLFIYKNSSIADYPNP